jgi:hypothetical protein
MLNLLKELLSIKDNLKDTILNFYLDKSKNSIKNYLNISLYEEEILAYQNQIIELAMFFYNNRNDIGKIQSSQGSKSQTLKDGIPNSIKCTLPMPFIKVVG